MDELDHLGPIGHRKKIWMGMLVRLMLPNFHSMILGSEFSTLTPYTKTNLDTAMRAIPNSIEEMQQYMLSFFLVLMRL